VNKQYNKIHNRLTPPNNLHCNLPPQIFSSWQSNTQKETLSTRKKTINKTRAVVSQGGPHYAAVNFGIYQSLGGITWFSTR